MEEDGWAKYYPSRHLDGRQITMGNHTHLQPGHELTFMSYDLPWANASNAPFRLFKHWVHEGGISTPLIAHWPRGMNEASITHAPVHVVDVLPTILDVTGASYPAELGGHTIQPMDGESFAPLLGGRSWEREQQIFWEHEGNCAVRLGQFKLVRKLDCPWELYDMNADRTELVDLIGRNKPLERRLVREFESWAARIGVEPWENIWPRLQAVRGLSSTSG